MNLGPFLFVRTRLHSL